MSNEEHYRALEKMYASAPCNMYYAPKMHISHGTAEVVIPIQEEFFHSAGVRSSSLQGPDIRLRDLTKKRSPEMY
jgi:hypothetical protein